LSGALYHFHARNDHEDCRVILVQVFRYPLPRKETDKQWNEITVKP